MAMEWVLVPVTLFISIAAVILGIAYFWSQRQRALASAGGDYRRLAEEAVKGQEALLGQLDEMNKTLREIEKLLREV